MASIVFGVVGAGVGSFFGNPMMGWAIGTTVGGLLFPSRLEPQQRGRLDDLRVTGSAYGASIPQVFGRMRLGGNVIWSADMKEHTQDTQQGGKGGGGGQTIRTYTYTVSCAVLVCAGPVNAVHRIWADDVLIYDDTQTPATNANITIYTGTETQTPDPLMSSLLTNVPAYRGYCYVVFQDMDLTPYGSRMPTFNFDADAGAATLGSVFQAVGLQCGLQLTDMDVTGGTDTVPGYLIGQRQAGKDSLEPMMRAFAVDVAEVDGVLRLVRRGGASAVIIPYGDLGAQTGSGEVTHLEATRQQEIELPARVDVSYYSPAQLYQQASQGAVRYTKPWLQDALSITIPMALDETPARQIAERLLYTAWRERTTLALPLPLKYLWLAPADVMTVPVSGVPTRVRITGMEIGLFGEIKVTAVPDDSSLLTQIVTGSTLTPPVQTLYGPASIVSVAWNGNALRDSDANGLGLYLAASGPEAWGGCMFYMSRDSGASYQTLKKITDFATMGTALTALSAFGNTAVWDTGDTVDVQITRGLLQSTSSYDVLTGTNTALIGNEIIQFRTATVIGPNQYRLSNLLRGQRGTDYAGGAHVVGETFVLLSAAVQRVGVDDSLFGKTVQIKVVPSGKGLSDVTPTNVTLGGAEFKPYAPCDIKATRDGSQNLTATWIRRTRTGGVWADGKDADLGETIESYDVEVWDATWSTVKRTFPALTTPTVTYTAAQQTADFGATQTTVRLKVYQNNVRVGRGYPAQAAV